MRESTQTTGGGAQGLGDEKRTIDVTWVQFVSVGLSFAWWRWSETCVVYYLPIYGDLTKYCKKRREKEWRKGVDPDGKVDAQSRLGKYRLHDTDTCKAIN